MRLIDADKLKQHISWWGREEKELVYTVVDLQPTVVEVVRCKDCKWFVDAPVQDGFGWCDWMYRTLGETFYCANGKRKDGADE